MLYIVLFFLSFYFTFVIKNYAIKKSLVDIPNARSSHTTPTPHGGGIAIASAWFIGLSYLFFINEINTSLYYALMVGVIISIVSYLDDLFELSPKIRLFTQFFVAILSLFFLGGFEKIDVFLFTINNVFLTNIFALFLIVWFINLYNFLDGIDGYAGTETLFLSLAAFTLFGGSHFLVLAVSVAGFLVWNWHKAKIFMGDVGSTLLGFNIAIFTIYYANQEASNFWTWIILFGIFWFDATLTLYRRYKNSEKLSQAHNKHAYQRLTQSGWTHSEVVFASLKLNILLFLIVYFIPSILIAISMAIWLLYTAVYYIDKQKGFF